MKTLVLLHGFLGVPEDWKDVIDCLGTGYTCYPFPLPEKLELFPQLLKNQGLERCTLVGYSMGGRVALQLQQLYPEMIEEIVLLSAHFGLKEEHEKIVRWQEDCMWAEKLLELPLEAFLKLWYAQPLFTGFSIPERRLHIDVQYHSRLLRHYSLSKQEYLPPLPGTLFLYGEKDLKYQNLCRTLKTAMPIKDSGHVIHLENPQGVAYAMDSFWQLRRHQIS